MVNDIRAGVIGATVSRAGSGWGADAHVPAIHSVDGIVLRAVCTSRRETAEASAAEFGAELALHNVGDLVRRDDIDLVVVCLRVPLHRSAVMSALTSGKAVLCEWPLGLDVDDALKMADEAHRRSLDNMIGLQARSDPAIRYARDLLADGYVGEVLIANLSVIAEAVLERGPGRIWQSDRANRANPLTIKAGHSLDALCYVLGEFTDVSARLSTRLPVWRDSSTGANVEVTAPDCVGVIGRLAGGGEVVAQVATVPFNPSGARMEIQGRDGSILLTAPSFNVGPTRLFGGRHSAPIAELIPPHEYAVGLSSPAGLSPNVAYAYARLVDAHRQGRAYEPDFGVAVQRHRLIEAIERSASTASAELEGAASYHVDVTRAYG